MKKMNMSDISAKDFQNEVSIIKSLSMLNHPNIVKYETSFYDEVNEDYVLVMEYCRGGNLEKFI